MTKEEIKSRLEEIKWKLEPLQVEQRDLQHKLWDIERDENDASEKALGKVQCGCGRWDWSLHEGSCISCWQS